MKNYIEFENTATEFKMIAIDGNLNSEPFDMGGDGSEAFKVRLSDYWICEYPVTQAVWAAIMGSNPSNFKGKNHPVENVNRIEITDRFLPKLNEITRNTRPRSTNYRLPTEAEWEYAAKGGKYWKSHPFKYSGSDKLNQIGWYKENSHSESKTVSLKTPNLLGLYDMNGNVSEWCMDWYSKDFYKEFNHQRIAINPLNRKEEQYYVYRGGSWFSSLHQLGVTIRGNSMPASRNANIGFRLALSYF